MQWISIQTLPKNSRLVLILRLDAVKGYAYPYTYEQAIHVGFYCNGKWFDERAEDGDDLDCVTHWMPLPDNVRK